MKRPCKWCSKELEEHEPYFGEYLFCSGQYDEPPEVMDYYEPCGNLEYLEYRFKKREKL